ncbi:MAG: gliding motility-associated C-terminal domain-containing protein, partial [Crocinitomicaceae bacterium]|nr:gliding motility-associated C-terminal domain-containing protein [Crocinitomicaceae bacterium]
SGTLGTATASVTGGTAPYNYSWNTTPVQTVQTASNLSAGNYTVTVTDDAGCITTESVTINSAPNAPTVTITSTDIDCSGTLGTATASVTGGTAPYNYSWNTTPAQTTPTATGLSAGTYTVTVTDNAGCSAIEQVVVMNPTQLTVSLDVTDTDCGASNGQITANVMGGTGTYSYTWTPSVGATATVSNLDVGNYDVTVTDENGCTATATGTVNTATTFVLDAIPVNSTIDLGGSVGLDIIVESGITVGTVDWSPAVGLSCTDCINPTASPSTTTTYYVIVTDTSGCIAMDSVVVNVKQPCGDLFVPTMFSPNSDNMNDLECVMGTCVIAIDFTIFDRWGEIVFHTKDRNNCWDGNFRGKPVQSGVYVYKLIATLENGDVVKDTGNINVVR